MQTTDQGQSKGKEKVMEEPQGQQGQEQQPQQEQQQKDQQGQEKQTAEAQMATKEQTTPMAPPRQDSRVDYSVLQTPQREDVSRKRERETPLTKSPEKRQRLNPF